MTLRIFLLHTKKITLGVSLAPPSAPRVSPSEPSLGEQGTSWEQSCFENQRSSSGEQQFSRHQLRCGQAPAQLRGVPGLGLHSTSERCPVSTPCSGEEPQKEKWPVERSKFSLETPDQICRESLCGARLWRGRWGQAAIRGFVTMVPSMCPAPERRRSGDRDAHAQQVQRGINNDPHPSRDSSRFFTIPNKP